MKRLWHFNILSKNARLLRRSDYWLGTEKSSLQILVHSRCLLLENFARKWRNCRNEKIKSLFTDRMCTGRNYQNMTLKFSTYVKSRMQKVIICKYSYWFTVVLFHSIVYFYVFILNPARTLTLDFVPSFYFFNSTLFYLLFYIIFNLPLFYIIFN